MFVGTTLSVLFHLYMTLSLKRPYPYNTFLFRPENRFGDFFDIFNAGANPYNEIKGGRGIFPLFMLISRVFYVLDHKVLLLILFELSFLFVFSILLLGFFKNEHTDIKVIALFVLVFCSFPVLFSLDRANIENCIFLIVFLSVVLCWKKKYLLASFLMGVAIAIKPYSIFFLPIFVIEGQIFFSLLSVALAIMFSVGALIILPQPITYEMNVLQANLARYNEYYVIRNQGLYFGTSIFGALKIFIYSIASVQHWFGSTDQVLEFNRSLLRPYFLATNIVLVAVVLLLTQYKTVFWKKIAILVACQTLFPYVGSTYRLLYFYIPMSFFRSGQGPA